MPKSEIVNVRLAGLSGAVPASQRVFFPESDGSNLAGATDVRSIGVAPEGMCASDLCCAAAERLLAALGWSPDSVEGLVFLTQTPDHILPATSCTLQHRLRLPTTCAAMDLSLGCSGYVYALWLSSMMVAGGMRRLLLLAGDTLTRVAAPEDRTAQFLGDAGTATALEYTPDAPPMRFELGTDGSGLTHLLVPAAGFRTPRSLETCIRTAREQGNVRGPEDIYMNAAEIFLSTLTRLPPTIASLLKTTGWKSEQVDYFVFNQTTRFALENLAKRMKILSSKLVIGVDGYGNTATASIPLALTTELFEPLRKGSLRLLLAGFGAGYSWGAATLTCAHIQVPELIRLPSPGSAKQMEKPRAN